MTGVIKASLYVFAGCAALGLIPAAVLAAKTRNVAGFVLALLVAAFVMFVLITAAADANDLIDAVMIPRRLKREQAAAGIEAVRRAGRRAWEIHQQQREGEAS